jgi:hypothetical protein
VIRRARARPGRLPDLLAAAAGVWAAAALVLAVLVALAVVLALVLAAWLAVADAAPRPGYQEPQATAGAGRSGGIRKAGEASRSSASSGAAAAASRRVSGGRFHLVSSSFSTDV